MSKRVIIASICHPILVEQLTSRGFDVLHLPHSNYNEVIQKLTNCVGIITATNIKVDRMMIDAANSLQWIGRLGSGMEHIDIDYANSMNIKCISSPEGNRNAVAEHCLGLLLNLMNNINKSYEEVKEGKWLRDENRGEELFGKTIALIGFGNVGNAFAKLLQPFEVKILANDINKKNFPFDYIKQASLEDIFNEADIVSLHLPLTKITKHLTNDTFFNSFKKSIYFINTSRGEVVETNALINALNNGKVKATALDVLENEKINFYTETEKQQFGFLLAQDNVIITPHIAGYSKEATYKMSYFLLEKLKNLHLIS